MRSRTLACCLVLFSSMAFAEEVNINVTKRDCARLLRHTPSADVAFQPGVGVGGRKVAPADLPDSGANMKVVPDIIQIPITIDGTKHMGAMGVDSSDTTIGTVAYDITKGTFTYNGHPLGSSEQQGLAEACRKAGVR